VAQVDQVAVAVRVMVATTEQAAQVIRQALHHLKVQAAALETHLQVTMSAVVAAVVRPSQVQTLYLAVALVVMELLIQLQVQLSHTPVVAVAA
jgi:hypothetical protein